MRAIRRSGIDYVLRAVQVGSALSRDRATATERNVDKRCSAREWDARQAADQSEWRDRSNCCRTREVRFCLLLPGAWGTGGVRKRLTRVAAWCTRLLVRVERGAVVVLVGSSVTMAVRAVWWLHLIWCWGTVVGARVKCTLQLRDGGGTGSSSRDAACYTAANKSVGE